MFLLHLTTTEYFFKRKIVVNVTEHRQLFSIVVKLKRPEQLKCVIIYRVTAGLNIKRDNALWKDLTKNTHIVVGQIRE